MSCKTTLSERCGKYHNFLSLKFDKNNNNNNNNNNKQLLFPMKIEVICFLRQIGLRKGFKCLDRKNDNYTTNFSQRDQPEYFYIKRLKELTFFGLRMIKSTWVSEIVFWRITPSSCVNDYLTPFNFRSFNFRPPSPNSAPFIFGHFL